jgi:glutathione S-transferase
MMKLFYAPQSPFARKARIVAHELGLSDQIELVLTKVIPGDPNIDFTEQVNPLRKIPALQTSEGDILYDSTVICEYLISLVSNHPLVPADRVERWSVLRNQALAQGMCDSAIAIRYETFLRPKDKLWQALVDDQWGRITSGTGWFETNHEILAKPLDLAQITLGCLLGYIDFRWPEHGWRESSPQLAKWWARMEDRPSFRTTIASDTPG